jgi:ribosomal protein S12 methylthiotransferase accessory factor
MKLESRPKFGDGSVPRIVPPEETARRVKGSMAAIGVTRISDTTGLDTIGIPVFSAIRPDDAGPAGISVFNGKGATKAAARAGAMMEAIERYCGEHWLHAVWRGTYPQALAQFPRRRVMDPRTMHLQQQRDFDPDGDELEWVEAWDLLGDRPALVPLAMVVCPYEGVARGVWASSSNGLASGNCLEEAISHALAELIERDAYTIATVRSQLGPRIDAVVQALTDGTPVSGGTPVADGSHAPSIRLTSLPSPLRRLVAAARRDGSQVWLRDITTDIGVPSFVASLRRADDDGTELAAGGFGCDPDAVIAASRALTEAVQGRNVQIQGVREDASAARSKRSESGRVLWCCDSPVWKEWDEIASYPMADILDDVRWQLDRLRAVGVTQAYAVDLTDPAIPAAVVRVIVPELECWFLTGFDAGQARLGWRARKHLADRQRP